MIYWPESIRIQIYEYCDAARAFERSSREVLLAEILLPIPDKNCTSQNYDLEKYEFSSAYEFYMRNKDNKIDAFKQSGILYAGVAWGIDANSTVVLMPPVMVSELNNRKNFLVDSLHNHDAVAALGVARAQDINELAKWVMKSNLDPNDPRNADLINLIRVIN
jgi:coiled-coil and C2 domain-containing protein 2A